MKIFLAQINPLIGDLEGNAEKIFKLCKLAFKNSANLVITPELSLWGYPPKDLLFKKNLLSQQNDLIDKLTTSIQKEYGDLSVAIGIAEVIEDSFFPNLYNSIALIEKGKYSIIARKIILPNYEVFDEKRYFRSDNKVSILEKKLKGKIWRFGITICEDLWVNQNIDGRGIYKKNPIQDLENKGIDCLLNLSASPYTLNKFENRMNISKQAIKHLKVPLIYLNQVGGNDDLIFDGNSFILNSNGESLRQLSSFSEDFSCWNLKDNQTILKNNHSHGVYCSIFDALVLGVKDYARKCGFTSALIGLSGGIDSALVAVIAKAALGSRNVFCISMPSKWNSESSKIDAENLARNLNINFETIPIKNIFNCFEEDFQEFLNLKIDGIANENMQSRIRGTLLMAIANQKNHLLLSTGNKSELAVGYCTLYGDMNGGLSVIGDLYKTNIFNLCNWLDSQDSFRIKAKYNLPTERKIIGDKICKKPPSAELGPNQLDSDSLPPYETLDQILKGIIETKKEVTELLKDGHEKSLIIKIIKLLKRAEFKRRQAPPILKLSNQSLGNDWRIPIAIIER